MEVTGVGTEEAVAEDRGAWVWPRHSLPPLHLLAPMVAARCTRRTRNIKRIRRTRAIVAAVRAVEVAGAAR